MIHIRMIRRHSVLLLEVIIAFALVALCVLPLIYPQIFILRSERQFINEVQLDHKVNILYGDIMEKLYRQEIPWQDIVDEKVFPIDLSLGGKSEEKKEIHYKGSYKFIKKKQKAPDDSPHNVYVYRLIFSFQPNEGMLLEKNQKPLVYEYLIPIERKTNDK